MARERDTRVLLGGQTAEGNQILSDKFKPFSAILDDSILKVSFAFGVETVPLVISCDDNGQALDSLTGFVKSEWQSFYSKHFPSVQIDWSALPEWRPGCGSLTQDPIIGERLLAESENNPLQARKIEIGLQDDVHEFMFDQGFTDGLPVVPPTPERVLRMLAGTERDPQEEVAVVPPNLAPATVEKVAINAVLAGCKPEYMPVVLAALEAVCTEEFNGHGVFATTMGASPVMVINGPIRHKIGMGMGMSVWGKAIVQMHRLEEH